MLNPKQAFGITLLIVFACNSPTKDQSSESKTLFQLVDPKISGLLFENSIQETQYINYLLYSGTYLGAGVGIGDFNKDGMQDIYFAGNQVKNKLFLNLGELKFKDITSSANVAGGAGWSTGVTVGDINGDGWPDIYISRFLYDQPDSLRKNLLYINNGNLTFSEKSEEFGIADAGYSIHANMFDYDKDGDLDLYVCNQPPSVKTHDSDEELNVDYRYTDRLYRNESNKYFTDVTAQAGLVNFSFGLSVTVADLNNDGWSDIYVASDFEEPDFMYINNGNGTFRNTINESLKHISNFSMGCDIADINNDLLPDIYVADMVAESNKRIKTNMGGMNTKKFQNLVDRGYHYQYMHNSLQLNQGNIHFSEISQMAGVSNTDWSWSPLFADFDQDGEKDLIVSNGVHKEVRDKDFQIKKKVLIEQMKEKGRAEGKEKVIINPMELLAFAPVTKIQNVAYKNTGNLNFQNKTDAWGLVHKVNSQGTAYADLDNDGDLDLVMNNLNAFACIYENHANAIDKSNYLIINPIWNENSSCFNAKVILTYEGGNQLVETSPIRGYMSSSEPIAHFGLGDINKVDKVEVIWPNNTMSTLRNVKANQILKIDNKTALPYSYSDFVNTTFRPVQVIEHGHSENQYDDFKKEILLPHRLSTLGPFIANGDVNNDGLDDIYCGGSRGFPGNLFIQTQSGKFILEAKLNRAFEADKESEDMNSTFFDSDNDGDLDLYVVSGGNEKLPNDPSYQDRLYLNDGTGNFTKSKNIPRMMNSGSCVKPFDFDQDGDLDLFVGGRQTPQKYPYPTSSTLLVNENGRFIDKTVELTPNLVNIGMVTDACWSDFNKDGNTDLILVGEWMPITILKNNGKSFDLIIDDLYNKTSGWWNHINAVDLDNDGDDDYIVGNLGTNMKYKTSLEEPFQIFSKDFDSNGTNDIYLGYFQNGTLYPVRGRECSSQQMPFVLDKFPTYNNFGEASLFDVLGEDTLDALHYEAQLFESVLLMNIGNERLIATVLPVEAQVSVINTSLFEDFDGDGNKDILIAGNNFHREVETTRSDAGVGLLLRGDGTGKFNPDKPYQSGFYAFLDVRNMVKIKTPGAPAVFISNNQDYIQAYTW